jgi:hypothetical protein
MDTNTQKRIHRQVTRVYTKNHDVFTAEDNC